MNKASIKKTIKESLTGYSDYIKGGKTKGLTHDELVTILTNAAKGIKPGVEKEEPKKEPKKDLKEQESLPEPQPVAQTGDIVDAVTLDVPLFLLLLEYAKEHAKEDIDIHKIAENTNKLCKERGILSSDDYNEIVEDESETDVEDDEPISEQFQHRLRENIKQTLYKKPIKEDKKKKKEKEEDAGEELESTVNISDAPQDETPAAPAPEAAPEGEAAPVENPNTTLANNGGKVNPHAKSVQDALTQAQVAAQSLGDQKLMDQIGNTITFFTRAHIVGTGQK